jgi:hypothetical protein
MVPVAAMTKTQPVMTAWAPSSSSGASGVSVVAQQLDSVRKPRGRNARSDNQVRVRSLESAARIVAEELPAAVRGH